MGNRIITRRGHGGAVTIQFNPIEQTDGTFKPLSMASLVVGEVEPGGPGWSQPVPDDIAEVIANDAGLSKLLKVSGAPAPAEKPAEPVTAPAGESNDAGKSGKSGKR